MGVVEYLSSFAQSNHREVVIHASAMVDPKAKIGIGVYVGPFAIVGPDVVLEDRVCIDTHAVVLGKTTIGSRTRVWPFASVGSMPQDLKYRGEVSELVIGEDNAIREYVNISVGTTGGGGRTEIGSRNLIMVYCHIGHDCHIGNDVVFANAVSLAGHVIIQDRAVFGGLAAVHQFCRIGTMAMVAGGTKLTQDIPPCCMAHGDRARIGGLNLVGMRRSDLTEEAQQNIKRMFRLLFQEHLTLEDALSRIEAEIAVSKEKDMFVNFLKCSERGICR